MAGKNIHHHQADPNSVKWTADKKKCIFNPRGLNIVWGNNPRYWIMPKHEGQPAELVSVSWLEVTGSVDVEIGKTYQIGFRVSLKPEASAWNDAPVCLSAKIGKKGKSSWKRVRSLTAGQGDGKVITIPSISDGRFEITVPTTGVSGDSRLYFGMYEVWGGKWKGGLLIHDAFVQEVESSHYHDLSRALLGF